MEDGIESIFTEELGSENLVGEDEVIDNPDAGADEFDEPELDDETVDHDTDTPDEAPVDDDGDGFDWNEIVERYGERTVTVKVQGEPVQVAVKDLPDGFMRREDYSRKTAEVSEVRKAAEWAQDVQNAFARDPQGTLAAFAQAYNLNTGVTEQAETVDPYEDFDPEVATVLRQRDKLLMEQQQQLSALTERYQSIEQERLMADVKAEVEGLRGEFGDDLDHVEMLRVAATYNMPLREAAETLVGRRAYQQSREQSQLNSEAEKVGARKADDVRKTAKRRASGTATKKFSASDVSVDDFSDIGELFEITANSIT